MSCQEADTEEEFACLWGVMWKPALAVLPCVVPRSDGPGQARQGPLLLESQEIEDPYPLS